MKTDQKVLITAPTGNVGPYAAVALADAGVAVRALVLADDPNVGRLAPSVEVFTGDLADPDSLDAALDGVTGVFWMWPFFTLSVETAPAVLAKIEKQGARVALVSSIGVHLGIERRDNNCHAYLEELLVDTDLRWTFLRTTGFMANALGFAGQIRAGGPVRFPYGAAARTPVDEADLAAIGAAALTSDQHARRSYLVTGPEVITQREQARVIGEVIGREIGWEDVDGDVARAQMVASGWPPAYADGALDYFARLTHEDELLAGTVEDVVGRPATGFRAWARRNAAAFR